jgi:tetratricopeptide (TPR) repeat protein
MPRRVNVKLLVALLVGLAVTCVGLYGLYGLQVRRGAATLLGRAEQAEEQGDPARAADYLRQYLTLRPDDGDVLTRFGLLLNQRATSGAARFEAFLVLKQAFRLQPERRDVGLLLVQLAMDFGRYADARTVLDTLLVATPDDGELEELCGRCEEGDGHYYPARASFVKAIQHAPDRTLSYERLAGLQRAVLGEHEEADRIIEQMVAANPGSYQAYLARGRYRQRFQSIEQAAKDMTIALSLAPQNAEVMLAAADVARVQNRLDDARALLRQAIQILPKDARMYTTLALVEHRAGRDDEGVQCLREGLKAVPESEQRGMLLILVDLLIQKKQVKEATALITRLRRGEADAALLDYQGARVLIHQGQWSGALRILERLSPALANDPELAAQAHLCRSLCYENLGAPDLQLSAVRDAVAMDPSSTPARLQLASALLVRGQIDDAIHELELITNLPAGGRSLLAQAVLIRTAHLPAERRDWGKTEQLLESAEKAAPKSMEVLLLRAELLALQGQPERGRQLVQKARDQQPEEVGLWMALVLWDQRFGAGKNVNALLDEAARRLGARRELQAARLDYWLRTDPAQARAFMKELERQLDRYPTADQHELIEALAAAYARLGDAKEAERLWEQLAARQPTNLPIRLRLFDLAFQAGDDEGIQQHLEKMRGIEGEDGTFWRYGKAAWCVMKAKRGDKEKLAEARHWLIQIAPGRRQWARLHLLEAEIQELEGDPELALSNYQLAYELGDHRLGVARRLVELLYERQQFAKADQIIRDLQQATSLSGDFGRLAAQVAMFSQDPERALSLAKHMTRDGQDDYRNHLWLGLSLWALGRRDEAEAALREAVRREHRNSAPRVALVRFLAQTGQERKAAAAIEEAETKLQASDSASQLALAQCYQAAGRSDQAERLYETVLAANPDDVTVLREAASFYLEAGRPNAASVLRRLADQNTAPAGDRAWARRQLALRLAKGGGYRQFQEALALVDRNLQVLGGSVEDQRAKALILAGQPSRQREAIALLEQLPTGQLTPDDSFLLCQLYEARQQWSKALDQSRLLVASSGKNPVYLAHLTRSLLRERALEEAGRYLARLEAIDPNSFLTIEMKARLLRSQGKETEVVALIDHFVQDQGADAAGLAASLLEELGQTAAAEKTYRKYVSQTGRPESSLVLATFLGRQNRLAEALDVCERAWQACPAEMVAGICTALITRAGANDEHRGRVASWLEGAAEKQPGSAALLLALAEVRNAQGRYQDAEFFYRQVVDGNPGSVLALNNLSWLLAKQGRGEEALALINRALELAGPQAQLLDTRAIVHLALGQSGQALKDCLEAVDQDSGAVQHFHLAQAHWLAGNRSAAGEALRDALAQGLKAADLHPLERQEYERLVSELDQQ